jgi:hypothetical protein
MSTGIASRPQYLLARLSPALSARLVFPGVLFLSLLFELLLAERKYALFGGGFGQSRTLDTLLEIATFLTVLIFCQAVLFYLIYRLLHWLHRGRADTPQFYFNFTFFLLLGWIGVLIGKYQALSYFSDAMSFQIIRNLGGGSLYDAMLYSLSETGLVVFILAGAGIAYAIGRWFLRRWKTVPPVVDRTRVSGRLLLLGLLAVPLVLFAGNRVDDSRSALARFNTIILFNTLFEQATDFDRDGWSLFSYPLDGHPFNAARHPYALDIPGNGIDEDGFAGDFHFVAPPPRPVPVIAGERPHVILIMLESTRGDVIGQRIGGQPVAPVIEAMARNGSMAERAYSHVGFTTASLKSLFTGTLDPAPGTSSLIDDFLANDYEVAVLSGQSEDFGGTAEATGMRRGSVFVDADTLREERAFSFAAQGSLYIDGRIVLREFDRYLGSADDWENPRFLYINFQSAHFPYHAPGMDQILYGEPIARNEISAANADHVASTYWNAIAYNDRLIAELTDRLQRLGVYDNSLIVITSDHGESLFDDGFLGHGHMLNEQQTRIPFIFNRPGIVMPDTVGLADMRDIILRAAGATLPETATGPFTFQFLGSLDRPGTIGRVDGQGEWLIFDLGEQAVRAGDGSWTPYRSLVDGSDLKAAADALITQWARERWLRHRPA